MVKIHHSHEMNCTLLLFYSVGDLVLRPEQKNNGMNRHLSTFLLFLKFLLPFFCIYFALSFYIFPLSPFSSQIMTQGEQIITVVVPPRNQWRRIKTNANERVHRKKNRHWWFGDILPIILYVSLSLKAPRLAYSKSSFRPLHLSMSTP